MSSLRTDQFWLYIRHVSPMVRQRQMNALNCDENLEKSMANMSMPIKKILPDKIEGRTPFADKKVIEYGALLFLGGEGGDLSDGFQIQPRLFRGLLCTLSGVDIPIEMPGVNEGRSCTPIQMAARLYLHPLMGSRLKLWQWANAGMTSVNLLPANFNQC